ncbi:unnamed protein product [Ascophyllum nodosum]
MLPVAGEGVNASAPSVPHGGQRNVSIDLHRDDPSSAADLALAGGADTFAGVASLAEAGQEGRDSTTSDSVGLGADGGLEIEGETACSGSSGGPPDGPDVRRSIGPALTSEAAGLSDLIRRRGGLAALSDGRAVAAVLRAAAPRRQSAFQNQRARGFFNAEASIDEGLGGSVPVLSTSPQRGGGNSVNGDGSRARDDRGEVPGGEASGVDGGLAAKAREERCTFRRRVCACSSRPGLRCSDHLLPLSASLASPQDTSGICQKLMRACPNPGSGNGAAACPHRSPRTSTAAFVTRTSCSSRSSCLNLTEAPTSSAGKSCRQRSRQQRPQQRQPVVLPPFFLFVRAQRGWKSSQTKGKGCGDVIGRASQRPALYLEEQLYAALGALLECGEGAPSRGAGGRSGRERRGKERSADAQGNVCPRQVPASQGY